MQNQKYILSIFICFCCLQSIGQTIQICNIKTIQDIEKSEILISEFAQVDTIVNGTSYNALYICLSGLTALGNFDVKGKKQGYWTFIRGSISIQGQFKKDKMTGKWVSDPEIMTYKRGKCKSMAIIF